MIVDTNILLYLLEGRPAVAKLLDRFDRSGQPLRISVVTRIEVLGHPRVQGPLDVAVRGFLDRFILVPLSEAVVERTIEIRRASRLKLPDAIIAATAREAGELLLTHDRRGFSRVPGLRVFDPLPSPDDDPTPSTVRDRGPRYRASSSGGVASPESSGGVVSPKSSGRGGRARRRRASPPSPQPQDNQ
jgi:hypothetical protein